MGELCKGEKLSISVIRGPELDQRPSFGCRLVEISTSENMVQRIMSISIKELAILLRAEASVGS